MEHPNFEFTKTELEALKARIAADETVRKKYEALVKNKEAVLAEDFVTEAHANSVFSQHGKYGDVSHQLGRMNGALGCAWLIEGDARCAARLRDFLLHIVSFACWAGPDNPFQEVPRKSELNTASIAAGAAWAYDILYDFLTPAERDTIGKGILRCGVMPLLEDWVLPETRIHAMDSMGHNWWAVCVAQGASALLPLKDHIAPDRYEALLDEAEGALIAFLTYPGCTLYNKPASYDEKGLFYESINYFNFATGTLLDYILRAERSRGPRTALREALPDTLTEALLAFAYPTAKEPGVLFADVGDGDADADVCGTLIGLQRLGYDHPAARAYLARRYKGGGFSDLIRPVSTDNGNWDTLPKTAVFPTSGFAFLRGSWENDAPFLAIRCGYTWNHAHADAGHFMIWDRGEMLLPDSATCDYYGNANYRAYFCKDEGHNVLLVGGQGQIPEDQYWGNKFRGKLFDSFEGPDFVYVGADATGPLAHLVSRAYRNFIWIENRVLVILDDLRCHTENTVQFLLHHAGSWETFEENGLRRTEIRGEKSAADVTHVYPKGVTVTEKTGCVNEAENGEKEEKKYLEFSTAEKAQSVLLITAVVLDPAENKIEISPLSGDCAEGIELKETDKGLTRRIWFNLLSDGRRMHKNSNNLIDGFDTDAYFFMRTLSGSAPETDLLACASFHRKPGKAGFAAFIKRTALYTPEEAGE